MHVRLSYKVSLNSPLAAPQIATSTLSFRRPFETRVEEVVGQ